MDTLTEPRSIAALRQCESRRRSVDEVAAVVDAIVAAATLDEMCAHTGWDPDEIRDLVANLGTWLSHVHGTAKVDRVPAERAALHAHDLSATPPRVVIPVGFGRQRATRRDTARSYAAIAYWAPDRNELARYVARRWRPLGSPTSETVSYVWYAAAQGYVDGLDRHADADSVWGPSVVAAWDLLEVARADAVAAVGRLTAAAAADYTSVDWDSVAADIAALRILDEPSANRLQARAVDVARSGRDTAAHAAHRELRRFATTAGVDERFSPAWVGELTGDQAHRIIARAGLGEREGSDRALRRKIDAMGLAADADVILGDLRRAEASGRADAYWEALERRAAGDESWADALISV